MPAWQKRQPRVAAALDFDGARGHGYSFNVGNDGFDDRARVIFLTILFFLIIGLDFRELSGVKLFNVPSRVIFHFVKTRNVEYLQSSRQRAAAAVWRFFLDFHSRTDGK